MKVKCNIVTPSISKLAEEVGLTKAVTCNLVSTWQTQKNQNTEPTAAQLKEFMKENESKLRDIEFAVPEYTTERYDGNNVITVKDGNIVLSTFSTLNDLVRALRDKASKDKSESAQALGELGNFIANIKSIKDAYTILLWRAQASLMYPKGTSIEGLGKKLNDFVINKYNRYKQAQPVQKKAEQLSNREKSSKTPSTATTFSVSASRSYPQRTQENAEWSDVTLDFSVDFESPGEKLTKRVAGEKFIGIDIKDMARVKDDKDLDILAEGVAGEIFDKLNDRGIKKNIKLNIAGNAINIFAKYNITQKTLNNFVEKVLRKLYGNDVTISAIRSGGQTGGDEAGIIAAQRLGIPSEVHTTANYTFRDINGRDISDEKQFKARFEQKTTKSQWATMSVERLKIERSNIINAMTDAQEQFQRYRPGTPESSYWHKQLYELEKDLKEIDKYLPKREQKDDTPYKDNGEVDWDKLFGMPTAANNKVSWARTSDNGYEVSTQGDSRFSALKATFKQGTIWDGQDISGMTIEDVYQNIIKKSRKGQSPAKDSILYNESLKTKEEREDYSYEKGYLPLWQLWASQHPEEMNDLAQKAQGKTLTDKFASTRVSQARALADILNSRIATSAPTSTSVISQSTVKTHEGNWSRQEVQSNPRTLYVFTDNTDRDSGHNVIPADSWYSKKYGKGHHFPTMTAAVIRGLDNARPISTQRWYHAGAKGATGRWTDNDVVEFKKVIQDELEEIVKEFSTGKYDNIVFPDGSIFNTRISNISKERTPKLYQALGELLHTYGFDNLIPSDLADILNSQAQEQRHKMQEAEKQVGKEAVKQTIETLQSDNSELSEGEKKSIKSILGDSKPRVLVASEVSDPVFHAQVIKRMVEEELKKPAKDRKFHMMYLITKHDGLPLKELAQLPIPKFVHFSITSLGGTKYEPGVMKTDDMLDRIEQFIKDGVLNPNLVTIRVDPIIPGVTKKEDIRHIFERATAMGIRQFKFSVMDSYGDSAQDRFIVKKMTELGYDFDKYYGRKYDGKVLYDAKEEYITEIYRYMDDLAGEFNVLINTCGEKIRLVPGLKHIKRLGCINVQSMNAALGTNDIAHVAGKQRPGCTCYGLKSDALRFSDACASSCVYCYAKHNSNAAMQYYNEDGTLKDNKLTRTSESQPFTKSPSSPQQQAPATQTQDDSTPPKVGNSNAESLLDVDKESAVAKLARTFTPLQRKARLEMLAVRFSDELDRQVEKREKEVNRLLQEEQNGRRDPLRIQELYQELLTLQNAFEGRKLIMQREGTTPQDIFNMIKEDFKKSEKIAREKGRIEKADKFKQVIDNFDLLIQETCPLISKRESVKILFSAVNEYNGSKAKKTVKAEVQDSDETAESNEAELSDDTDGERAEVNGGFLYKARFTNPATTLSKTTKKLLSNLAVVDSEGNMEEDDMGVLRFMDPDYCHSALLNELSSMISPEDFAQQGEDGNFTFPLLEKAKEKYPWAEQLIWRLEENPDYISSFYADLRKDHIPYWMQAFMKDDTGHWKWVTKQLNQSMARDSIKRELQLNYEHGYKLDEDSIYENGGKINSKKLKAGIALSKELFELLREREFNRLTDDEALRDFITEEQASELLDKAAKLFRIVGINITPSALSGLLGTREEANPGLEAVSGVESVLSNLWNGKIKSATDIIRNFNKYFADLADKVAPISQLAQVGSFRVGNKTYYSYSAPNYVDTMVKQFKREETVQQFIDNEFKQYSWFYDKDKGEWNNTWIEILEKDPFMRMYLATKEVKTIRDKVRDPNDRNSDYRDWEPSQIRKHFIFEYFTEHYHSGKNRYAWYAFPIFSDSPVAKFIRFKRYVNNGNETVEEQLLPLFRKVVKQELYRMKLVAQRRAAGASRIDYFDKNGSEFCFFPEFNTLYINKETGDFVDGFYDRDAVAGDNRYISFKDRLAELAQDDNTTEIDRLIDRAVKASMDDKFDDFLSHFGVLGGIDEQWGHTVLLEEDVNKGIANTTEGNELKEMLRKEFGSSYKMSNRNFSIALHEYFWNNAFAQTQIIQLMTTDLAFYKDLNDFQKRFKEVYASGTKLFTMSKYGKKNYKSIYLTDSIITSPSYNDIKASLDEDVKEGHLTQAERDRIVKQLSEINVADAQALRSLDSMRSILDMMGLWTPAMDTAYDHITNGKWDMNDLNVVWQTLKPFLFTQLNSSDGIGGRMKVPHHNKNSEFALLQAYMAVSVGSRRDGRIKTKTSNKLKAIADFMNERGIDMVQFQSAVKVGNQGDVNLNMSYRKLGQWAVDKGMTGIVDVNDLEEEFRKEQTERLDRGEITQEEFNRIMDDMQPDYEETKEILENAAFPDGQEDETVVHTIPFDDYIIQQPTPEHLFDAMAVFGSQFRNLLVSDLPENFSLTIEGRTFYKKDILNLYDSLVTEGVLDKFDEVKEKFSSIERLQQEMMAIINGNPKYGRDLIDAIQLVDVTDEDGTTHKEFDIPLNHPATINSFAEVLLSMFKKVVTDQKVKGGACILVSSFGFTDELHVLHNADGSIKGMECYMPAYSRDFFAALIKEDKDGNPYLDPSDLPNDLRKAIGYRIPTEDKYSMAPLYIKGFLPQNQGSAIMLPAETTLFSGEDFDVDKKFMMLPEFRVQAFDIRAARKDFLEYQDINSRLGQMMAGLGLEDLDNEESFKEWFNGKDEDGNPRKEKYRLEKPIIEKVKYDINKPVEEQSAAARNNMMFDLAYGILTSRAAASSIHNPGSFDKAKREARMARIIDNMRMRNKWAEEHKTGNDAEKLADSLLNASLEELAAFTKKYERPRSPLTIDTFVYNHVQNMTGDKLIGMYANNTSMQAKYQTTSLAIKDEYTFIINGRRIKSLHDIISSLGERISKNCAQFSAASVDNVKDPVLADLLQTTKTANTMGMLLRAGLSIKEAALMFQQPIIKDWAKTGGTLKSLQTIVKKREQALSEEGVTIRKDEVRNTNFTTKNLMLNALGATDERQQLLIAKLFLNMATVAEDLAELTRISRADSPKGAVSNSIAGLYTQMLRVGNLHERAKTKEFTLSGIEDGPKNNQLLNLYDNRDEMRKKLRAAKMPRLQAFYSLGIEAAMRYLTPYFAPLAANARSLVRAVDRNSNFTVIPERTLNAMIKDMMHFALTHTRLFGNGIELHGESTYRGKRDYYLYEFPKHVLDVIANNPDIAELTAMRKLYIKDGSIRMDQEGRNTGADTEALQRDFDNLLYMDNPAAHELAVDLFMYSFYKEGFNYSILTLGNNFSTVFLNSIPEYRRALKEMHRDLTVDPAKQRSFMDKFLPQFYANKINYQGVAPIISANRDIIVTDEHAIIPFKAVKNPKTGGGGAYQYIGLKTGIGITSTLTYYVLDSVNGDAAIYSPATIIRTDDLSTIYSKYDANAESLEELAQSLEEDRRKERELIQFLQSNGLQTTTHTVDIASSDDEIQAILDQLASGSTQEKTAKPGTQDPGGTRADKGGLEDYQQDILDDLNNSGIEDEQQDLLNDLNNSGIEDMYGDTEGNEDIWPNPC